MRVGVISDLHWGVRSNSLFFLDKMEEFYYGFFIPYLKDAGIDTIWILGDVFENRKQINIQVLNRAQNFFQTLHSEMFDVYCISGNHDYFFKNTNDVGSLAPVLKPFPNVRYVHTYDTIKFDETPVGFISWISPEIKEDALRWIQTVDTSILCGHFEINSFEIIKGVTCHSGFEPGIFERFDCVLSGHFHIRARSGVINYLGNPYQTNWSEAGFDKGFHVFDTRTKNLEFVKNPINIYDVIHYNDDLDIVNFDAEQHRDKIIRIFAENGRSKNKKKLELLVDAITNVCQSVELIEDREVLIDDDGNTVIGDTSQLIRQFLTNCEVEHIDRNLLERIVFDVYREALERGLTQC